MLSGVCLDSEGPLNAKVSVSCVDEVGDCEASSSQGSSPGRMVVIWKMDSPGGVRSQPQEAFPMICTPPSLLVNTSNCFYY